jgi:hypothetical protein
MALRSARSSGITGREIRRLQWQAFESSVGRQGVGSVAAKEITSGEDPLLLMDQCLAAVAKAAGLTGRLTVPQAKELLRSRGAGRLASRIGEVSKCRNRAAHRDVGLPELILEVQFAGGDEVAGGAGVPHLLQESAATKFNLDVLVTQKVQEALDMHLVSLREEVQKHKMDVDLLKSELSKLQLPLEAMGFQLQRLPGLEVHLKELAAEVDTMVGNSDANEKALNLKFTVLDHGLEEVRSSMCEAVEVDLLKGELFKLQMPIEALRRQSELADFMRDALGSKIATIEHEVAKLTEHNGDDDQLNHHVIDHNGDDDHFHDLMTTHGGMQSVAAHSSVVKRAQWLNEKLFSAKPIDEDAVAAMVGMGRDRAMELFKELEEKSGSIKNPSGYLKAAARREGFGPPLEA